MRRRMNCSAAGHGREERRLALTLRRRLEPDHHARRAVDEQRDAAARIRHLLAREPGERIGQRDREERHAGEEQQQRHVPHAASAATGASPAAAPAAPPASGRSLAAAAPSTSSSTTSASRTTNTSSAVCASLELQVAPAGAHPLVPRGAQRDQEGLRSGGTQNPDVKRRAQRLGRAPRPQCARREGGAPPACSRPARCRAPTESSLRLPAVAGRAEHAQRLGDRLEARARARASGPWPLLSAGGDRPRCRRRGEQHAAPARPAGVNRELSVALGGVRPDDALADRAAQRDRAGDAQRGGGAARELGRPAGLRGVVLHAREGRQAARRAATRRAAA